MKRIVLFYPSNKLGMSVQPRIELPLSLLAIATPLDRAGYEVSIIDQRVDPLWKEHLTEEILKQPICVGISSMTGPQIKNGLEVSGLVREHGDIPIVWGGIHPTLLPGQTLEHEDIDIVVQGEGEETFFELVQVLERGTPLDTVQGIWYKEDGQIKSTGSRPRVDLNEQPPLSYHLVDMKKYLISVFGVDHISFETSRGCPFRCGYCYNTTVYKSNWLGMSTDEVVRRVKRLVEEYGIKGILFSDDNFFGNKRRAIEIIKKIKDENPGILISKIDAHSSMLSKLTDEELTLLKESGCRMLMMGIESGSPRILELMNKKMNIPDLISFNKRLINYGIMPHYFFMMGFPTETLDDISQTLSLKNRLSADNPGAVPRFNIFTPFPGTPLFDISVREGLKVPDRLEDWVSFNYRTVNENAPWLTEKRKKIIRMLHFITLLAERNNFINPYKKTRPLVSLLALMYYPIARFRMKYFIYQFLVELKVAEWLGIYPKQGGG
ncbi:B12-binding domain-containing radical SAM protein [Candidatus Latescibacterota bacterium]